MDDDVGTEVQWVGDVWRQEGVVDDQDDVLAGGVLLDGVGDLLDVGDLQSWVGWGFDPDQFGVFPSPFDAWLTHRGLKTLHLRVRQAALSANKIAEFLAADKENVVAVNYPGLKTHPNYDVVLK